MGFLRTNYADLGQTDFSPLPIGDYEVIVSKVEVGRTQSGEEMLKVELTVREDVEQMGKKRRFFENVLNRDSMSWKFQQIAKAVQLPEGIELATIADFAKAIQFRTASVRNKHEVYNDKTQDKVAFWNESKVASGNAYQAPFGNTAPTVSDDDIPF